MVVATSLALALALALALGDEDTMADGLADELVVGDAVGDAIAVGDASTLSDSGSVAEGVGVGEGDCAEQSGGISAGMSHAEGVASLSAVASPASERRDEVTSASVSRAPWSAATGGALANTNIADMAAAIRAADVLPGYCRGVLT